MITAVTFVVAASVGALVRAEVGRSLNRHEGLAVGTLVVNITGSFLLGLLSEVTPPTLTVVGVAGLGSFTTFSSFARDAVALVEQAQARLAVGYVIASLALGIGAAAGGIALAGI